MNREKVAVVIVTFNRCKLLKKTLYKVLGQTRKPDAIFLVNNASTDDTLSFLKKEGVVGQKIATNVYLNKKVWSKKINFYLINLAKNIGGSGGFNVGVKWAYRLGYDWVWLMDDDVYPVKNGLKILLSFSDYSKCILANRRYKNGFVAELYGGVDILTGRYKNNLFGDGNKYFREIRGGVFEGLLIHRSIIKKIGFPDRRFFLVWDDNTYCLLASFYTKVICLKKVLYFKSVDAIFRKTLFGFKKLARKDTFFYYLIRNRFILLEYLKRIKGFNMFLGYFYLLISFFYMLFVSLVIEGSWKKFKYTFLGFIHGLKGVYYKGI